jgi:hypothetical protein
MAAQIDGENVVIPDCGKRLSIGRGAKPVRMRKDERRSARRAEAHSSHGSVVKSEQEACQRTQAAASL